MWGQRKKEPRVKDPEDGGTQTCKQASQEIGNGKKIKKNRDNQREALFMWARERREEKREKNRAKSRAKNREPKNG